MKLIPASSARCTMRTLSSWSVLPMLPKDIAPRHRLETRTPERPSERISISRHRLVASPSDVRRGSNESSESHRRTPADHTNVHTGRPQKADYLRWCAAQIVGFLRL